ncbi:hypothetical protein ABIQ69_11300 [Agromyces sp. G08B096]|uniref:Uncharacterized protein n=1 Tax=Agromyces sp. G08B096 TaxID=3156399 RepID=A0AAU7W2Y9_9MICO
MSMPTKQECLRAAALVLIQIDERLDREDREAEAMAQQRAA